MLTAKDAMKVSERAANDIVPVLMEEGLNFVKECAEKGHAKCSYVVQDMPWFIIKTLIKKLKKLGYKAEFNHHLYINPWTIDISW